MDISKKGISIGKPGGLSLVRQPFLYTFKKNILFNFPSASISDQKVYRYNMYHKSNKNRVKTGQNYYYYFQNLDIFFHIKCPFILRKLFG